MTISYLTQSKNNPALIYVRLRSGREIDVKCKTGHSVNPQYLKKGKIVIQRIPPNVDAGKKVAINAINANLLNLQEKLDKITHDITFRLNNLKDYEIVDLNLINEIIHPRPIERRIPNSLEAYFDFYVKIKTTSLAESTIKKNKSIKERVKLFEQEYGKVFIQDVNNKFSREFQLWCDRKEFHHNTKLKTLKVIKTVCNHAKDNGISVHPQMQDITKGLQYKDSTHIHLTLDEIQKIFDLNIKDKRMDIARDWLILSCFTAQRVSDFMKFGKENIVKSENEIYLQFKQQKTGNPVSLPLPDMAVDILDKHNGGFPPFFSTKIESNNTTYNKLIKRVCREAGITQIVKAQLKNPKTNRSEIKEVPKYKAVSTHIGRRSYATNFDGDIETSLLMKATGHTSEAQFRKYVGQKSVKDARALASEYKRLGLM